MRQVLEGRVVGLEPDGRARVQLPRGRIVVCRRAQSVDLAWLEAALRVGPVDAELSLTQTGRGSLWAVFPGPEHRDVKPLSIELSAEHAVSLVCGDSTVTLSKDGEVRVRGRDVLARGSQVARLQGGTVRIN